MQRYITVPAGVDTTFTDYLSVSQYVCVCECILGKKRNLNKTMLSYVCVCVDDSLGNYNTAEIKSSMKPCMNINIQFHNFSRLRAFSKHPIFPQLLNCFIRLQPV